MAIRFFRNMASMKRTCCILRKIGQHERGIDQFHFLGIHP